MSREASAAEIVNYACACARRGCCAWSTAITLVAVAASPLKRQEISEIVHAEGFDWLAYGRKTAAPTLGPSCPLSGDGNATLAESNGGPRSGSTVARGGSLRLIDRLEVRGQFPKGDESGYQYRGTVPSFPRCYEAAEVSPRLTMSARTAREADLA